MDLNQLLELIKQNGIAIGLIAFIFYMFTKKPTPPSNPNPITPNGTPTTPSTQGLLPFGGVGLSLLTTLLTTPNLGQKITSAVDGIKNLVKLFNRDSSQESNEPKK